MEAFQPSSQSNSFVFGRVSRAAITALLASHDLVTSQVIHTLFPHLVEMSSYYQMKAGKYRTHDRSSTYPPTYLRRQNGSYYGHQARRNGQRRDELSELCTRCRCNSCCEREKIPTTVSTRYVAKATSEQVRDAPPSSEESRHPFETAWEAIRGSYYDAKAEEQKATHDEKGPSEASA